MSEAPLSGRRQRGQVLPFAYDGCRRVGVKSCLLLPHRMDVNGACPLDVPPPLGHPNEGSANGGIDQTKGCAAIIRPDSPARATPSGATIIESLGMMGRAHLRRSSRGPSPRPAHSYLSISSPGIGATPTKSQYDTQADSEKMAHLTVANGRKRCKGESASSRNS